MVSPLVISLKRQKGFLDSRVSILSPAKINLYLNIIGKYTKGFHRIESIVERISLCDDITIKVKKDPTIDISSNIKTLETKDNLIFKAISILKKKFKIPFGFDIYLNKNIPLGSGLGGGSSNAASAILALKSLFGWNLNKKDLYQLGAKLGSDVNFFLAESQFALLEGRGEKVTPLDVSTKFKHFVIWPALSISTKEVYKHTAGKLTKFFNNVKIMQYALKKADSSLIKANIFNALEKSACLVNDKLREIKSYLLDKGFIFYLTGSGSAFYSITALQKVVRDSVTIKKLKKIAPSKWLILEAQTF